ncbi:hypothetical protein PI124_g10498 [Phytophthora idaei]|nr:hypothetical protein PI125_g16716 [Phytophthora idaei]KAG3140873.1 hypothetical protein PI126_g15768 [Phytophthora idaei]KAG3244738.1 hypothetical protein PI124_g10498 [Phytophthora idaei]
MLGHLAQRVRRYLGQLFKIVARTPARRATNILDPRAQPSITILCGLHVRAAASATEANSSEEKDEAACDDVVAEENSSSEDIEVESSDVGSREEKIELESAESTSSGARCEVTSGQG